MVCKLGQLWHLYESENDTRKKFILYRCYILKGGKRKALLTDTNAFEGVAGYNLITEYFEVISKLWTYKKTGFSNMYILDDLCTFYRSKGYEPLREQCYDMLDSLVLKIDKNLDCILINKNDSWFTNITTFYQQNWSNLYFNDIANTIRFCIDSLK